MTKKKVIRIQESLYGPDGFEGELKTIRESVNCLIEQYGEEAIVEIVGDHNIPDCYITYHRLETDKEFERRLKKEEKQRKQNKVDKAKKEEKEKKELARLLEKYPDEVK